MDPEFPPFTVRGMAGYFSSAQHYVKTCPPVRRVLAKKPLEFRVVVEAPDYPPAFLLQFHDQTFSARPVSAEVARDKSQWDAKLSAPAHVLVEYFVGRWGVVRPLLFRKIKATRLLRLTKLIPFMRATQALLGGNKVFVRSAFDRHWAQWHRS